MPLPPLPMVKGKPSWTSDVKRTVLIREGARHSWCGNPNRNTRSSVPRHREINDTLVRKICKDLAPSEPRFAVGLLHTDPAAPHSTAVLRREEVPVSRVP